MVVIDGFLVGALLCAWSDRLKLVRPCFKSSRRTLIGLICLRQRELTRLRRIIDTTADGKYDVDFQMQIPYYY